MGVGVDSMGEVEATMVVVIILASEGEAASGHVGLSGIPRTNWKTGKQENSYGFKDNYTYNSKYNKNTTTTTTKNLRRVVLL